MNCWPVPTPESDNELVRAERWIVSLNLDAVVAVRIRTDLDVSSHYYVEVCVPGGVWIVVWLVSGPGGSRDPANRVRYQEAWAAQQTLADELAALLAARIEGGS